jgi:GNAT superfamily N-acetyltransferase
MSLLKTPPTHRSIPVASDRICLLEEWRQARATAEIADESEDIAGGTMCFSGSGSWSNQAAGLGLRGPVSGAELDRLVAFYRDRGAPPRIEVAAHVDSSLLAGLRDRGFGVVEFELVFATHVVPGEDCAGRMTVPPPPGVEIRRHVPGDDAADEAFVRVAMSGFVPEGEAMDPVDIPVGVRTLRHPRAVSYGAWADGELVAAAGAGIRPGVPDEEGRPHAISCFFGASVLPAFRRRGVQQALIAARLQACADAGCELACIHGSPGAGTERNARRMGFTLAYTKLVMEPA